jgi:hypothetical protein
MAFYKPEFKMPINYKEYPANWKTEIRPSILERAGHKCERKLYT